MLFEEYDRVESSLCGTSLLDYWILIISDRKTNCPMPRPQRDEIQKHRPVLIFNDVIQLGDLLTVAPFCIVKFHLSRH